VPSGLRSVRALAAYDGPLPAIVLAAKNGRRTALLRTLGSALAELAPVDDVTMVTWAPTTAARRRERGFDHAEILARAVARRTGLPCVGLLARGLGAAAQCGRTARERHDAPRFVASGRIDGCILLVDDVCTTGATLRAGALALLGGGADAVDGLVLGRVGLKPSASGADIPVTV